MASLIPVAKALYLCDDILSDSGRVKPHLIGVLNAVRISALPQTLAKLCIFAQLVGGFGEVRCSVRVVRAQNREAVYQSPEVVVQFDDRGQTRYFYLRLTQITIRTAEEFWVELYCNDQYVDDATLEVVAER